MAIPAGPFFQVLARLLALPPLSIPFLSAVKEGLRLSSFLHSERVRERERGMKQGRERKTSDPPPTLLCVAACHCLPACIPVSRTVLSAFGTVNGEPTTLLIFLNVIICQPCMLIVMMNGKFPIFQHNPYKPIISQNLLCNFKNAILHFPVTRQQELIEI